MAEFINPTLWLDDLRHVFEDGARKPMGIVIDPELCRHFVAGLGDIIDQVDTMAAYLAALGHVERLEAERPRTPVERRQLARRAIAADPTAKVVRLPTPVTRSRISNEGGTAA